MALCWRVCPIHRRLGPLQKRYERQRRTDIERSREKHASVSVLKKNHLWSGLTPQPLYLPAPSINTTYRHSLYAFTPKRYS